MKLILILLLPFMVMASEKTHQIKVFDFKHGFTKMFSFKTNIKANEWLVKEESKKRPFGGYYSPRDILKEDATAYDLTLVTEEYEVEIEPARQQALYELNEEGEIIYDRVSVGNDPITGEEYFSNLPRETGEFITIPAQMETRVKLKKDYRVEIEDLSLNPIYVQETRIAKKIKDAQKSINRTNKFKKYTNAIISSATDSDTLTGDIQEVIELVMSGNIKKAKKIMKKKTKKGELTDEIISDLNYILDKVE